MSLPTDFPSCSACGPGRTPMGRHTCWRRETDSESAEEPPPAEQQHTTDNQPKGPGSVKDGGHHFEMKMAVLTGLRGLQRGDNFELFSNRNDAGNFDDLVYTAGGRRYFLQLKHADNTDKKKLTKEELVTLLQNCYKSYYDIKHSKDFRDISVDKTEFIIYTNRELGPELLKHDRQLREIDMIFKTSDNGEIFNFAPDKNKEIDVYTLVENSVKKTIEFRDLCDREMVKEFLKKLIVATGQKGRGKLDEVIKEEIRKRDAEIVDDDVYSAELLVFKEWVEAWCRNTKEKMTATMFRNWLQEAKTASCTPVVSTLFVSCAKKLARTGITFSDCEISRLQAELSNKRAVHLRSDALTLCSILMLDCLPQSKCIFVNFESLQSNKKQVFHAWLGGHWEWLIVSCDTTVQPYDISKTCREIRKYTTPAHSKKYFIILTHYSVQEIQFFTPIDHRFKFEQLSDESQAMVLDKKIDFQGCEVTMRSVLQRHGNVEHVLGPELVTDLITEKTAVNIGGKLHVNTGYYAPRVLERKVWLYTAVLWNEKERFAISGAKEKDVLKIVPSAKTFEFDSRVHINATDFTQDMTSRIFLLPDEDVEDSFLAICEKLVGKSLHWVKFNNGVLTWKMSQGGTDSLLEYVDAKKTCADMRIIAECMKSGRCEVNEESIWDLDERTVLVVAEPSMGKSSTTTQVAWHTKQRDPTSWVVRINWNDHTRKLQEIKAAVFNFDSLVEFLCNAAFPDSKYPDINSSLLKQALQNSGNVTVLMDGFDEISRSYADKAAVILSELMKTKVEGVWVTSRPVVREKLEKELSVTAFSMKNLSRASQVKMFRTLLVSKAYGKEYPLAPFIEEEFLMGLNNSFYKDNFTGCPLNITIIATVCEKDMEMFLNPEEWFWRRKSHNKLKFYESFVERKLHIYLKEKAKAKITNSSLLVNLEYLKQLYLKYFQKCSLAAILPTHMMESLHNKKMEEEIQPLLRKVEAGKDKTGIVMDVVEGKPQFLHRNFAEYFTARWFSENFESNRSVLEHILFEPEYSFMTDMFDRMLAEGCPLHCAVLNWDTKNVETLLEKGCDVNAVDKGGRTVMHLLAACRRIVSEYPKLITHFTYLVSHYKVPLDNTDCVLQWTPLQYAINSEEWDSVEWLLERNVDRSGLDMITERAHNRDYIGPIIREAERKSHVLLLKFVGSIGVNIHQARSTRFRSPMTEQMSVAMVRQGDSSLDVRDNCGRTAIDWAKYNASHFKHNYPDFRKYKVEADIGYHEQAASESVKEPPTAKQQRSTRVQPNAPGSVKDGGHHFEMKMAALIGLRGFQRGDNFELSSNRDGAGNFDDLVYTADGRRYFLQLEHVDITDEEKLTKEELVTLLQKCFRSYCAIKYSKDFRDIPIDKTEFLIYTNRWLDPKLSQLKRKPTRVDIIFRTCDKGEIFSFSPDKNKRTDVYTILENSVNQSKEFRDLCHRKIVTEFLNKLIMVTGQKGQRELDELIIEEIRKGDTANVDNEVYSSELLEFKTRVETWCRDTKDKMTATMFRNWLQEAKTESCASLVRNLFKSYTRKLARTGIEFSDSEISRLKAEISNNHAVHMRSDALTLCSILLLDCLATSKCIFLNFESLHSHKSTLLHAWLGGHWEWLIVSCDSTVQPSDISNTCLDISSHITPVPSNKHFIILTYFSVLEMQGFTPIDHRFKSEQLSKKLQGIVLDKKIDFQGCEVTMRSVLQRHGNVEHVLGPELVTDLITEETPVNVGGKLQANTGHYACKFLKRKIYLKLDVLRNSDSYPDIFAVSGIEKKGLVEIVPSDESVGKFYLDEDSVTGKWTESYSKFKTSRFIILRSKNLRLCFFKLCEKHSGENLHWLKYKNGNLLWKESCGGIDNLLDYIKTEGTRAYKQLVSEYMSRGSCEVNEELIWDLGERTVLVVAKPGMGKSSTTTHVAWHTKERDPTSWVVRINWNDHTRELQEIDVATFNLDTLVEFLCSAAFPDSKYTDINRSLLKQALQSSGNVTVLMDGFDEISPTYADKTAVILSELTKTNVGRLWVTSRPVERGRLEKELCVPAFTLKTLSYESQE